jgi:predicted rRNA methylase YqxC with S4 and FtsJ domains
VRSDDVRARVVSEIAEFGRGLGLDSISSIPSPIRGAHGNEEFLLGFRVN